MSVDQMLREMVREEVERMIGPLQASLDQQASFIARLGAAMSGAGVLKRGPGRPPKALSLPSAGKRGGGRRTRGEKRACALVGCKNPARSKGYCAAHYQKWRNLSKTGRLPADWVADAAPHSVKNIKLPRGRAGAKALAEAKK
jgi:hypothetical protein